MQNNYKIKKAKYNSTKYRLFFFQVKYYLLFYNSDFWSEIWVFFSQKTKSPTHKN